MVKHFLRYGIFLILLFTACRQNTDDQSTTASDQPGVLPPEEADYEESAYKWGYINKGGRLIISAVYDDCRQFKDGFAVPNAKVSTFKSKIKRFDKKRSAQSIIFDQSPVWQNWQAASNVGPNNLQDAPVMLSLGPGNYWMFDFNNRTSNCVVLCSG